MLAIDTNVLVRFLVRDDEVQFDKACRLIKREGLQGGQFLSVFWCYWKPSGSCAVATDFQRS